MGRWESRLGRKPPRARPPGLLVPYSIGSRRRAVERTKRTTIGGPDDVYSKNHRFRGHWRNLALKAECSAAVILFGSWPRMSRVRVGMLAPISWRVSARHCWPWGPFGFVAGLVVV